jgi:FKBP-type peptidyl-prolyl cis-trans isomerase
MSVKDKAQRTTIIIMAVVFFVTSVALSIFVIIDAVKSNKDSQGLEEAQQQQTQPQNTEKLADFEPIKEEVTEMKVTDSKEGDGTEITKAEQTVTVDYTGAVAETGVIFDSSKGKQPLTSPLTGLIKGWQEGMIGMKVGGERRMIIPAELAYGANPPQGAGIPANAALVFDVSLKEVK